MGKAVRAASASRERDFRGQVIDLARLMGWRVAHFRPALRQSGKWSTPVQADGAGFPDLVLVRPPRIIFAELKVARRKPTPQQQAWLQDLAECPVEVYLWRPSDWEVIVDTLKR